MGAYDATKAAVLSLTRTLAFEEGEHGVRVNAICPGFTRTPFHVNRLGAPKSTNWFHPACCSGGPPQGTCLSNALACFRRSLVCNRSDLHDRWRASRRNRPGAGPLAVRLRPLNTAARSPTYRTTEVHIARARRASGAPGQSDERGSTLRVAPSNLWRKLPMLRRSLSALALSFLIGTAQAQTSTPIKIGVLNDQSSIYADLAGPGSVIAARLAVEDVAVGCPVADRGGRSRPPRQAESRSDTSRAAGTRRWRVSHRGLTRILDCPCCPGSCTDKEKDCAVFEREQLGHPRQVWRASFKWTFNTASAARSTASAVIREGGKSWFFLAADYAFGHAMVRDASAVISQNGGRVVSTAWHPLGTSDFASYLLRAQASGAQVVALAVAVPTSSMSSSNRASSVSPRAGRRSCRCRHSYLTFIPSACRSLRTSSSPPPSIGIWMTRPGHGRSASEASTAGGCQPWPRQAFTAPFVITSKVLPRRERPTRLPRSRDARNPG